MHPHSTFLSLPSTMRGVTETRRLGERISGARARLRLTQQELADRIGVSVKTVNNLEAGRTGPPRPANRALLEDALGWAPGSVRAILDGGEPTVTATNPQPAVENRRSAVGGDGDGVEDEILFRLPVPPGTSPQERRRLQRIAEASVRAALAEDDED